MLGIENENGLKAKFIFIPFKYKRINPELPESKESI